MKKFDSLYKVLTDNIVSKRLFLKDIFDKVYRKGYKTKLDYINYFLYIDLLFVIAVHYFAKSL